MGAEDIKNILEATGLPYVQDQWADEMPLPCLIYRQPSTNNIGADGRVAVVVPNWGIELYTEKVDSTTTQTLIDALAGVFWEKTDAVYITSEKMYVTYFDLGA